MLEDFDPKTIEDESLRQVVIFLMNQVETLSAKLREKDEENQRRCDEISRLKGEQGKPKIKANKPTTDLSAEKERRESKPRNERSKQDKIKIDREVVVKVDPEHLPADSQFKGDEEVVVQDIDLRTAHVKFRKEKYYSPSTGRTYQAE